MAETVLTSAVEVTLDRVVSLITNEISGAWNLKDDLKELQESLTIISDVLQEAEEQQTTRKSIRLWLNKLKDVAYEAEDVIDEFAYKTLGEKVPNSDPSIFENIASPFIMARKVQNINKSLDKIKNEAMYFGLHRGISSNRQAPQVDLDRVSDSVIDIPVIGREADVSKIVNVLTHSCDQQLTIIPIVGMGGLGKTALAKLVCQEVMGSNIFDVKLWVCVSENLNEQKILGEMLQSLNAKMGGLTNRDAILQELEKSLGKRRFLLVLDDVWENVSRCWDDLKCRLLRICSSKGNAVLVTTRSEEVASTVESSCQYRLMLDLLSDDECWSILKERAYRGTSIPPNLESIGREIARKCKGVPLAAKVIGGTLGFNKDDEREWLKIRNSKVLNIADKKENVESILKLSFDHLPSFLKPCFSFCSVFPKDFWFEKEQLIQLWMAEGFVESCDAEKGSKYFNALLENSFFQDAERNEIGDVKRCKMHDLVHDLALSLSRSETLNVENYLVTRDTSRILRLYADDKFVTTLVADKKFQGEKLRTLILVGAPLPDSWKLESLRSLTLNGDDVEELPSSIGEWKHLRHLDVSNTKIRGWPESIGKLYNLHTLKFCKCKKLAKLPKEKISNLISLKHIDFSYPEQMPAGLGGLSCLEKLPFFVVGPDDGGSIQELEYLNELRGQLSIRSLEKVNDKQELERASLSRKAKIEILDLEWATCLARSGLSDLEVLEGLRPHPNIKSIRIHGNLGEQFPSWMSRIQSSIDVNSPLVLDNLVDLSLVLLQNCEQLPELGNLPRLKYLYVSCLPRVRMIGNEFYGVGGGRRLFPSLKSFGLSSMSSLVEWKAPNLGDECVVFFPCLDELSIFYCSKLKNIPLIDIVPSLVKLTIDGCVELESMYDEIQSSFSSLTSLKLRNFKKLTVIPNGLYSNRRIEELDISHCRQLVFISENLGKLNSLTSLNIENCSRLRYFPENILCKLIRLKELRVGGFSKELDDFRYLNSIQDLPCLKELRIKGSNNHRIMSLPDQLQGLTALRSLHICNFKMVALPEWLLNLHSLQYLTIGSCFNLQYESTTELLQRFSNLRDVEIYCCPFLGEDESGRWSRFSRATKIKVQL